MNEVRDPGQDRRDAVPTTGDSPQSSSEAAMAGRPRRTLGGWGLFEHLGARFHGRLLGHGVPPGLHPRPRRAHPR